jgi:hypothetical protein
LVGSLIDSLTQLAPLGTRAVIHAMSQRARVTPLVHPAVDPVEVAIPDNVVVVPGPWDYSIILDGIYPGIIKGDVVFFEFDDVISPYVIQDSKAEPKTIAPNVQIPLTVIKVTYAGVLLENVGDKLQIWFSPVQAGELIRLPATTASAAQILAHADIDPLANAPLAIVDAEGDAVLITTDEISNTPLTLPATIYTNLALATRGRTVKNEILGSGDASIPFQSFRLKKSPLTYLVDPSAPNGRRSTLDVYVNGQKWRQAQSFYGALPTDQIYVVRHDEDHQTEVVFGDGELGQRIPSGGNNVVATYRFGVGGNVPANSITAPEKPVKGIRKVFNPLPAAGGKEPPTPEQLRRETPLSTLVLGRLVSLPDFEAEARRYGNVVNAKARWDWNDAEDSGMVQIWFATRDQGVSSTDLCDYLRGLAAPNTRVNVAKATDWTAHLRIDLVVDPRYRAEDVELEVARRLFDDWDGVLSVRNVPIGRRLYRSKISASIHTVPGVLGVTAIAINGVNMGPWRDVAEGIYPDFENIHLIVGGTEAGKILFGEN